MRNERTQSRIYPNTEIKTTSECLNLWEKIKGDKKTRFCKAWPM
jgi:hypothetical protein